MMYNKHLKTTNIKKRFTYRHSNFSCGIVLCICASHNVDVNVFKPNNWLSCFTQPFLAGLPLRTIALVNKEVAISLVSFNDSSLSYVLFQDYGIVVSLVLWLPLTCIHQLFTNSSIPDIFKYAVPMNTGN